MIKIAPSILSADFTRLGEEIAELELAGADMIHFDVMDGVFVPNISVGFPVLRAVRNTTALPLDVHLMIDRPIRYAERFCERGADIVTVHIESDTEENISRCIDLITSNGKRAGLSVKPGTPIEAVYPYLDRLSLVLIMTVEPGFGGQSFMPEMLPKITKLREYVSAMGYSCDIEVDGGIVPETARAAKAAGADILVSGSSVFNSTDRKKQIELLRTV